MKKGVYLCSENWRQQEIYHIVVEAYETNKSFVLRLIRDESRFPDGHMEALFGKDKRAVISKTGSQHSIVNNEDWFVVYPNRNGVPFLFEYQGNEDKEAM